MNFLNAFPFLVDNWSLVQHKLVEHIVLSAESIAPAVVLGILLGVVLGHLHRFSFLAINVSNLGRALPSLGILAICLPFIGVGVAPVIIAMIILAFPPILTNAYVAVDGVDPETVDAAKGIGLRPWQVLLKVEIPLALPLIFAGVRTSAVFVIATATLAGIFGGGGLGDIVVARESYHLPGVLAATYVLVVLCFIVQGVLLVVERLLTPAGLRRDFRQRPQTATLLVESGIDPEDPNRPASQSPELSSIA